jgi:hypothetical protein
MINILDIDECPKVKTLSVPESGSASVFEMEWRKREPIYVGPTERDSLNPWTEGVRLACFEFLIWDDG